jgi:hypothetical protein
VDGNLLGKLVINAVDELIEAKEAHGLSDRDVEVVASGVVLALGGRLRDDHPLSWRPDDLRRRERFGRVCEMIRRQFPAWDSYPHRTLGDWLKIARPETQQYVAALLHNIGEDVRT